MLKQILKRWKIFITAISVLAVSAIAYSASLPENNFISPKNSKLQEELIEKPVDAETTEKVGRIPEEKTVFDKNISIMSSKDTLISNKNIQIMAWIYPGKPGCNAKEEYKDGRKIDILKPEYFKIGENGALEFLSEDTVGCNGFSPVNIAELAKYSEKQFLTVSSAYAVDMGLFLKRIIYNNADIDVLIDFVNDNHFEGIELDFEDFGGWTSEYYDLYKRFVTILGHKLHANNKELMLVGPATANTEQEAWFVWRYEDFVHLPVDMIIIMTYDYQFDHGAGKPIAPFEWFNGAIKWAVARFPKDRIGVGIPSYGYRGRRGESSLHLQTQTEILDDIGINLAKRDPLSGELTYTAGVDIYFYQDSESMDLKYTQAISQGIQAVSVWSLGGNPWFKNI